MAFDNSGKKQAVYIAVAYVVVPCFPKLGIPWSDNLTKFFVPIVKFVRGLVQLIFCVLSA